MIKKDVTLPASEDNWIVLSEREYIGFEHTKEGQERKKNMCQLDKCEIDDAMLFIETDAEYVKAVRKEKDRKDYVKESRIEEGIEIVSLNYTDSDDENEDESMLIDWNTNVEALVIKEDERTRLAEALNSLTGDEYKRIFYLFLSNKRENETTYAKKIGKTQPAVCYMKKEVLWKLKMLMKSSGK